MLSKQKINFKFFKYSCNDVLTMRLKESKSLSKKDYFTFLLLEGICIRLILIITLAYNYINV